MTSLRNMTARLATTARGADAAAMLGIACFFALFFGWILFGGKFIVGGDAFAYSYPLRTIGWGMIRGGQLPLWTPLVLSGYPLLSMSQLAFAYPLTWGYLFLDAPRAEQLYVLAPFLLAPAFTYAYARELGRSRMAALLAGLSFGYGGAMTGLLGVVGFFTNAMMWLPLMLIAIERARRRSSDGRRFAACLLGASAAYAMSVLTGLAQGFVFVGLLASAYALFLALFDARAQEDDDDDRATPGWLSRARWRPVAVAVGAIALGAGVGAFQILETMRAVRRSIRRTLIYPFFVSGSFSPRVALKSLAAPLYTERFADVGTYVAPLVLLLALVAVLCSLRRATRRSDDARIYFWAATALVAGVLILGKYTPIYGLLYHIPVINSFRVPSRFAFVWTFAAAILAAYGWDALACLRPVRTTTTTNALSLSSRWNLAIVLGLAAASALTGYFWWRQTIRAAVTDLDVGAGVPRAWLEGFWYAGLPISSYLVWKLIFTVLTGLLIWRAWKIEASKRARGFVLLSALMLVCFVEPFIVVANWWSPFAKPPARFTAVSPVTRFLQAQAGTTMAARSRIYTRVNLFAEEFAESPRFEPPNLTALHALENVGGYEPLLFERYSRALGNVHLDAASPLPGAAPARSLLDARSHVLDLLGARFVVNAGMPATNVPPIEKEGVRFEAVDLAMELQPGEKVVLTSTTAAVACDTLALVTSMSNSAHLVDGETVALLRLHTTDGRSIERPLRAGSDTAEWAHERADVRRSIRHALAPIFDGAPVSDAQEGAYSSNRYLARIPFETANTGGPAKVERVELMNVTKDVPLALWKATLYDSTRQQSQSLKRTQRSLYAGLDARRWAAVYEAGDVLILENRRALPRAWLVAEAEAVDGEEALRRISGEGNHAFDPRRTALLEVKPEELPPLPGGVLSPESEARVTLYEPSRIVVETRAVQPTVLVVSEIIYPGWEATIDGEAARIHTTNFILRGVVVPAGEHRVEMRYRAPAARNGAAVSALTLLLLVGLLAIHAHAKKSARRGAA